MEKHIETSLAYFLFEKAMADLHLAYLSGHDGGAILCELEEIWATMDIEDRNSVGRMIERVYLGVTHKGKDSHGNYA